jgi:hypothetical protein
MKIQTNSLQVINLGGTPVKKNVKNVNKTIGWNILVVGSK